MKWRISAPVIFLLALIAGCSNTDTRPTAASPHLTTTTTSPSSPSHPQSLGSSFTVTDPGLALDVTVFDVNQNLVPNAPAPDDGGHWVGADVQTCLRESRTAFTVGWTDWSVSAGSRQYPASATRLDEFPIPQFPPGPEPLANGECTRGWVVFAVAYGVEITIVKYAPQARVPAFWSAS